MSRAHDPRNPAHAIYETAYRAYESGGYVDVTDAVQEHLLGVYPPDSWWIGRRADQYTWLSHLCPGTDPDEGVAVLEVDAVRVGEVLAAMHAHRCGTP